MSNEFQDMSTAPTLTLDPFQTQEEKKTPVVQEEPALDDSILTEEERRTVDAFAQQIDLTNSAMVLQYGAGTQKKMADLRVSTGKRTFQGSGRGGRASLWCCEGTEDI